MTKLHSTLCALCLALPAFAHALSTPMTDGRCSEYAELGAATQTLESEVQFWLFQDDDYLWLCMALPEKSFGTLDLHIDSPGLDEPRVVHVSAQLGEWPLAKPEQAPQSPDSPLWWQIRGWTANPMRLNGSEQTDAGVKPKFLPAQARELQFSKDRFGRGDWRIRFDLNAVMGSDGLWHTVRYPSSQGEERPWATINTLRPAD